MPVATTFDPDQHLAEDWPDWTLTVLIGVADTVKNNELVNPATKQILIDPCEDGEEWAKAHVLAHLELGHHLNLGHDGWFTKEQEACANFQAEVWLLPTAVRNPENDHPENDQPELPDFEEGYCPSLRRYGDDQSVPVRSDSMRQ